MSFMRSTAPRFPSGWPVRAFDDVVEDATGGNPKVRTSDYLASGSLPVIDQGQEPVAGYVNDGALAYRGALPCVLFGDHTRTLKYAATPFALGADGVKVLVPRAPLTPRFLYHYLRSVRLPGDLGYSRHFKYLKEALIPVPSPDEQRRITEILDEADAVRRKRREALAIAGDLADAAFLEMFGDPVQNSKGWPVRPLAELGDIVSGVAKGKQYEAGTAVEIPYMRVANVQDGHLRLDDVKSIVVSREEARRYLLESGDVLLTEGGDPDKLGRGAVWRGEVPNCIHQNHIFRVRPVPGIVPEFLSAQLGSTRGKRYFLRAAKQTTGIASINMTQLKAFPTLVPPRLEQERFLAFVRQAERVCEAQQWAAQQTDALFHSLVHRAFRGELTRAA